jgi:hypothetical protein
LGACGLGCAYVKDLPFSVESVNTFVLFRSQLT